MLPINPTTPSRQLFSVNQTFFVLLS